MACTTLTPGQHELARVGYRARHVAFTLCASAPLFKGVSVNSSSVGASLLFDADKQHGRRGPPVFVPAR